MKKTALITGVTGQDGSYLAELLLGKGYRVVGIYRRASSKHTERVEHLIGHPDFILEYGDMCDLVSLQNLIRSYKPDEIYNLAAQSDVKASFDIPKYTAETNAVGVLNLLEAVRGCGLGDFCRIYQASTSELFGNTPFSPQNEETPFCPGSPYAVAKQFGFWIVREYRNAYGMYCCNGILFNHESPRRGERFVTRKITLAASRIACGLQDRLYLGNLNSLRDWGYAADFVEFMWKMLQQEKPDDYVLATENQISVRDFAKLAFGFAGFDIEWRGSGENEVGIDRKTGRTLIAVDRALFRPTDVTNLLGDSTKAKKLLGWDPDKTSISELARIMVESDMKNAALEKKLAELNAEA